jgi:hypothetical protein
MKQMTHQTDTTQTATTPVHRGSADDNAANAPWELRKYFTAVASHDAGGCSVLVGRSAPTGIYMVVYCSVKAMISDVIARLVS